jgi:hypothetical protein
MADLSLRNADFPQTFISAIEVDLTSPNHWVTLTWAGPHASSGETGPFHSSPGAGTGSNNCDDETVSRTSGSNCTPKGQRLVEGFADHLRSHRACRFVTWFHLRRGIAFHSHAHVPNYPASHGCVRLDERIAQLIHNNARSGVTTVTVSGTWRRGP